MTDERSYPARPLLAVSAAVFRNGRVLLARRAGPVAKGVWSLPGGLVELGETLEDAARREVLEETGVTAEPLAVAGQTSVIRRDAAGRVERHYAILCFSARWIAGEATALDDTDAVEWRAPEALSGVALTAGTAGIIARAALTAGNP